MATTITAKDIESLGPGRHRAADNLYLTVSQAGARSWVFLYRWCGRSREAGLGKAGNGGVSLGEARRRAEEGIVCVKLCKWRSRLGWFRRLGAGGFSCAP
jgi:hypothetical protein